MFMSKLLNFSTKKRPKSSSRLEPFFCRKKKDYNVGDIIIKKRIVGRTPVDGPRGGIVPVTVIMGIYFGYPSSPFSSFL